MPRKKRSQKTDGESEEVFLGPIHLVRRGSRVMAQNLMNEEQHAEVLKRAAEHFPALCASIDERVATIRRLVCTFDPLELLHRGYFNLITQIHDKKVESEFAHAEGVAFRMIDYIQSVIVSTDPETEETAPFTEERWQELRGHVDALFIDLALNYHLCRSAQDKLNDPDYNHEYDNFYMQAQMEWLSVRGDRYMVHDIPHLHDVLLPHDDVLRDLFGVSARALVDGAESIVRSLSEGLNNVMVEMEEIQQKVRNELASGAGGALDDEPDPARIQAFIEEQGWDAWRDSIAGRMFGLDLFDVDKLTGFPAELLRELSWEPGADSAFFGPGSFAGWPLRVWPVHVRPFLRLGTKCYCFEYVTLMDSLYRVIERLIRRLRPSYRETWNQRQKAVSESLPFDLLRKLLPGASVHESVYYRWTTGDQGRPDWCETDGLVIYDDHIFIVEVKGGAFCQDAPATDFPAHMSSVEGLVLHPASQARRFIEYLESADEVTLFDSEHKPIASIRRDAFRCITPSCFTLDSLSILAAQVETLQPLGLDIGDLPTWYASLDDLRAYADIFTSPLVFCHFIEQRMRAFSSPHMIARDELDHAGLYLEHNTYTDVAAEFAGSEPTGWFGYRDKLDRYFHRLYRGDSTPLLPGDSIREPIFHILRILESKETAGRCRFASTLLDMDAESRKLFCDFLQRVFPRQRTLKRIVPITLLGERTLTIFCHTPDIPSPSSRWMEDYAYMRLLRTKCSEGARLLLTFDANTRLTDASFEWLSTKSLPSDRVEALKEAGEEQAQQLIATHKDRTGKKKIGRNEPCPCGSGKKFKRCCGTR